MFFGRAGREGGIADERLKRLMKELGEAMNVSQSLVCNFWTKPMWSAFTGWWNSRHDIASKDVAATFS
jgi:hypothetical protein